MSQQSQCPPPLWLTRLEKGMVMSEPLSHGSLTVAALPLLLPISAVLRLSHLTSQISLRHSSIYNRVHSLLTQHTASSPRIGLPAMGLEPWIISNIQTLCGVFFFFAIDSKPIPGGYNRLREAVRLVTRWSDL